ncbi:WecB/TagA/CpsF family glycosyltransferase [bacterium]|nr:WecB/TagA/CpsF family glycosyltransferase [bacterium]
MSKNNTLFKIKLSVINVQRLVEAIVSSISKSNKLLIVNYLNVHGVILARKNSQFRGALNQSDIVFCDGFGVKLAAKILGTDVGDRMTPPDWIDDLFKVAEHNSFRLYFVGDEDAVIIKFIDILKEKFPNIVIAGFHHGFFHDDINVCDWVVQDIASKKIDILIVGMGMPVQEIWIDKYKLKLNAKVILTVGALYRWYSQTEIRGAKLLTDNGFEWLTRLIMYPQKVWKRYMFELPQFIILVINEKIRRIYKNLK